MPGEVKRGHYVPQFYLKGFERVEKGQRRPTFWVYDKKQGGEPRRQTAKNTAVEARFYEAEVDGKPVPLEAMFAEIESASKPVLARWSGGQLDRQGVPVIALFLSHLYGRVPRNIAAVEESGIALAYEMMKSAADESDEQIAKTIQESGATGITVEQARDAFRNVEARFKISAQRPFWIAQSIRQGTMIEPLLRRMSWTLCQGPPGTSFITSDTPLCVFARTGKDTVIFGGGVGLPGAELTFPVSPSVCLFLTPWRKPSWLPMTRDWVSEINRRMARIAERYVIATERTQEVDALVEEGRASIDEPKMDRREMAALWVEWKRRLDRRTDLSED